MDSLWPLILLLILAMASGGAWLYIQYKGEDIDPKTKAALGLIAIPLALLLVLLQFSMLGGKKPDPMPGDNDIDTRSGKPPGETTSERIGRMVEEESTERGSYFRDVAGDDEVAGRGAVLFDPGKDGTIDNNSNGA